MPIVLPEAAQQYFMVAVIIGKGYNMLGYTGNLSIADLAYNIMNLANGHMVAQPGASDNCFFISCSAPWVTFWAFQAWR